VALGRVTLCAICGREARGFGYCHQLAWGSFPFYRFCSVRCQDIGVALAKENFGMIDKTVREKQAIKDARKPFAEALTELGLMDAFFHRTADDIDRLIEACVDGFHKSLTEQTEQLKRDLNDEIPF
jgi:hypothetical protein